MNVYLDTSALVKLYIEEAHRQEVLACVHQAKRISTHVIASVETYAAFSRLYREQRLSAMQYRTVKLAFEQDWPSFLRMECDEKLLKRSCELTEIFALRAYDSVHLAAAELLWKETRSKILFACFDNRLNTSAKTLGLDLL